MGGIHMYIHKPMHVSRERWGGHILSMFWVLQVVMQSGGLGETKAPRTCYRLLAMLVASCLLAPWAEQCAPPAGTPTVPGARRGAELAAQPRPRPPCVHGWMDGWMLHRGFALALTLSVTSLCHKMCVPALPVLCISVPSLPSRCGLAVAVAPLSHAHVQV